MDVISLSSDSSRPSSPFINSSEVFNVTEKHESGIFKDSPLISPLKKRNLHSLSESDDSDIGSMDKANTINLIVSDVECDISLDEEINNDYINSNDKFKEIIENDFKFQCNDNNQTTSTKYIHDGLDRTNIKLTRKFKITKEQRDEEKMRKQKEKELIRSEKRAAKELLNRMKPNNCMKYMTVILDSALITCPFSGALIAAIQNSESRYEISTQAVPLTVSWTRETPGPNIEDEKDLVLIWQWELVVPAIKQHTLISQIQDIQAKYPSKCIFLIIYGLNDYFRYLKTKRSNIEKPKAKKGKLNPGAEEIPFVTKKDIEEELIELQISMNCSHRLIESPEDLGNFVVQITKGIAETPFK